MKLLLIEDEKDLAESIKNYLADNSFVCEWANNAKSAIEQPLKSLLQLATKIQNELKYFHPNLK